MDTAKAYERLVTRWRWSLGESGEGRDIPWYCRGEQIARRISDVGQEKPNQVQVFAGQKSEIRIRPRSRDHSSANVSDPIFLIRFEGTFVAVLWVSLRMRALPVPGVLSRSGNVRQTTDATADRQGGSSDVAGTVVAHRHQQRRAHILRITAGILPFSHCLSGWCYVVSCQPDPN